MSTEPKTEGTMVLPGSKWRKIKHMPGTARLELRRRLAWPLVRAQFAWHGIAWGAGWKIFGRPILQKHRGSRIALGDGLSVSIVG